MDPHRSLFSASVIDIELDYDNLLPSFSNSPNDFKLEIPSTDLNFLEKSLFLHDLDPIDFSPPSSASQAGVSSVGSGSLSSDGTTIPLPTGTSPGAESSSDDSDFSETVLKYINQILMEEKPCMFYDPLGLKATEKSFNDVLNKSYPSSPNQPSSDDSDFSETVLKYINQILMEEKPCMFYDPLGLKATEKSFYDVLNKSYPSSPNQPSLSFENPENFFSGIISDHGSNGSSTNLSNYSNFASESKQSSLQLSGSNPNGLTFNGEELVSEQLAQSHFSNSESVLQFKKGLEEASKFLPEGNQFLLDLESNMLKKRESSKVDTMEKENSPKNTSENAQKGSRGRKNHEREDEDAYSEEGRSNKQSAVYLDEGELSEMFDKVLLHGGGKDHDGQYAGNGKLRDETCTKLQIKEEPQGSNEGKSRVKRRGKRKDSVDLRTLLILCAQSVSSNDRRGASELLKQIREHSTPIGDGSQRLAHYFANALEARLAGTGTETKLYLASFASLVLKKLSAYDFLKAYQAHLLACPFRKNCIFFANKMIFKIAEKAETLHIIDFGIFYGFQWPILIQHLSFRTGGPPKLRITGIELPQPGFRPLERIEETGRRLEKYCNRFNVPFEYNAIASYAWETIGIKDLKIDRNEVIAVNCMLRFKNLLDETIEANPKNAVLALIRKINPNIFVHSIINGSYNAPFFITRFREALFHYSTMYDMFDTNISRENEERMIFEKEFLGRQVMNVIACEGVDRVERPETYKQWQVRCLRAGFRQLPLDQEIMDRFRWKLKACYNKDFVLDEDGNWMLQGWKGRIVYASSCWVPA